MATTEETLTWRGLELRDSAGEKIGTIDEIYEDTQTGRPEWALVKTGLFGSKSTFVPLREASHDGEQVSVPYDKAHVKDAPRVDPDGTLSHEEEHTLYEHYSLDWGADTSGASGPTAAGGRDYDADVTRGERRDDDMNVDMDATRDAGRDYDADVTRGERSDDDAMTRSEEELRVGTESVEGRTARLRKFVVMENVETTVPVQREEVRIEREPITDGNRDAALSGAEITEAEHEVTLYEERPVVETETVPKERVRLEKETHTEEQTVSGEVRKERIEPEGEAR